MLLYNATIYSNDFSEVSSSALIENKKIIKLYKTDPDLDGFLDVYNCNKQTIIPAFHDCHVHLEFLCRQFNQINLKENVKCSEFYEIIEKKAKQLEPGMWIKGGGFGREFLENKPDLKIVDQKTPNNPIFFYSRDIHSFFVNSYALNLLTKKQKEDFSDYIEFKNEKYTGMLYEKGESLFEDHLICTLKEIKESFKKVEQYFFKNGITSVHNMDDGLILDYISTNKTDLKVFNYFRDGNKIPKFEFNGAKLFADGSLGSLTASMFENYDNTDTNGIRVLSKEDLQKKVDFYNSKNIPVAIHAIGDKVCSDVLNIFSEKKNNKNRLEHAQTIKENDISLLNGVICSMQPGHIDDDIEISSKYLKDRICDMYRFKSVLKNAGILLFGSDAPVVEPDVFKGIYNACIRKDRFGNEWNGVEKISRVEALKAYCQNAKIIENRDCDIFETSSCDLILLDDDIVKCSEDKIKNIKVIALIKDGIVKEF